MNVATRPSASRADLLTRSRQRLEEVESRLADAADGDRSSDTHRAVETRLLLECGRHDEAWQRVRRGELDGDLEARLQAAAVLMAVHDYERLAPLAEELMASDSNHDRVRRLAYRWWFAIDDLEGVERLLKSRDAAGATDLVDRLCQARLQALLLDFPGARKTYETALGEASSDKERAWSLHGLGLALYRLRRFDEAFERLVEAHDLAPLDSDLLTSLADTLIRLSRTDEAIELYEYAVRLAPYHERAHYMLGNGYARKSYSQLFAAYPEAFADEDGRAALAEADALVAAGKPEAAAAALAELRRAHPGWADVAVRQGSLAFTRRRYAEARRSFEEALAACGEYGRAHNGFAKAVEASRALYNVYREHDEKRFAAAVMPEVEGIEDYVANWASLEPRHRKIVALAVAPWRRYVPVLIEAGSTHYIKPLHERLSESPEQDLLADERIHYDSRLWDDVRGVGGYHTVTGVEDVERIPWTGYNTVIHELTHQVHQVLPSESFRRIQELYRRTKERDEDGGEAFLSRYAGGSVWEYFAEGANALVSPRRDRFDTREIVRERLEERDTELERLVRELMDEAELDGAYTVARVNRGSYHLRRGRHAEAIEALRGALERSPDSEQALESMIFALKVAGRAQDALELARDKARTWPESASLAIGHCQALWLAGHGLGEAIGKLRSARGSVREEERFQVDLLLGYWAWTAGDADTSRESYEAVLEYQSDHPQGLWGLASARALAGAWEEAWKHYEEAVRHRTGVVGLRSAYAWDLLRAGELERMRAQLDAALLLDPEDPDVLALEALWFLEQHQVAEAREKASRALETAPWCDLARLALARTAGSDEEARETAAPLAERISKKTPPEYVYRSEKGSYVLAHTLPAVLREAFTTSRLG